MGVRKDYCSPDEERYKRPNYETAEEYNKARRAAGGDSPHGTTYSYNSNSNVNDAKKTTLLKTFLSMGGIMMAITTIFSTLIGEVIFDDEELFSHIKDGFEYIVVDSEEDDEDYFVEYSDSNSEPLPDGFHTFRYKDVSYSLPMTFSQLEGLGFDVIVEAEEEYVDAEGLAWVGLADEAGIQICLAKFRNDSDEEKALEECEITDITFYNESVFYEEGTPSYNVTFLEGIDFTSTKEEVMEVFGEPYYTYIADEDQYDYEAYYWQYSGDNGEFHEFAVTFWDGVISEVNIEMEQY